MIFKNVELSKFPEFDEVDSAILGKSFESFFGRVSFMQTPRLHLSHKEYARGGLKKQHEVHVKFLTESKAFFASQTGWQLLEVIQDTLKKLEREVLKEHSQK
jgi:hypothetical protein